MDIITKISIVQAYINHMTGKTIKINIPNTPQRLLLLEKAFQIAYNYFEQDPNGQLVWN